MSSPERLSDDHVRAEVWSSCWFWWVFAWRTPCCLLHQDPLISSPCRLPHPPPPPPPDDDDDDDRDDSLRSAVPSRENLDQSSPAGIWEARRRRPGNPAHRGPASRCVSAPSCEDSWTRTSDRPTRSWVCYMRFSAGREEAAGRAERDKRTGWDTARCTRGSRRAGPTQLWAQLRPSPLRAPCVWKTSCSLSRRLPSPCFSCDGAFSSLPCVRLGDAPLSSAAPPPRLPASRQVPPPRPHNRPWLLWRRLRRSNVSRCGRLDAQGAPLGCSAACGRPERFCRASEGVCDPRRVRPLSDWHASSTGEAPAVCGRGFERDGNFLDLECRSYADWTGSSSPAASQPGWLQEHQATHTKKTRNWIFF